MAKLFTIRQAAGCTTATINGLPPGGRQHLRPYIIPIFLPMAGCAHRCAFCNQWAITGTPPERPSTAGVARMIHDRLPRQPLGARPVQIAFYGGNFLGLAPSLISALLATAGAFVQRGDAAGIRFSTRPDTITNRRLAALAGFPVTTIELGLQSLDDRVLTLAGRGHDAACVARAARTVRQAGIQLGLQMMTGLPGDTPRRAQRTANEMVKLAPDFVRIYPTLVLDGSPLADRYRAGAYTPATLEETIALVSRLVLIFAAAGIPVIRMGLQADESLAAEGAILAGPFHPALGEQVCSRIFYALAAAALDGHPRGPHPVVLRVHPRHLSRMIGPGRANQRRLQNRFKGRPIMIRSDSRVGPHHLELTSQDVPPGQKVDLRVDNPLVAIASR
jgi:histone acetyltransferase (RNA polymerase elongator complex component)